MAELTQAQLDDGVRRLRGHFRHGQQQDLDNDVLISVLQMMGGDVQATITFLEAGQDDFVEPPQGAEGLPRTYMDKPPGWKQPSGIRTSTSAVDPKVAAAAVSCKAMMLNPDAALQGFLDAIRASESTFVATLVTLVEQGVALPPPCKARALAAVWSSKLYGLAHYLLTRPGSLFAMPEVVRAVRLVDVPRRLRALDRRLERLRHNGGAKATTLAALQERVTEVEVLGTRDQGTSAGRSLCRQVRRWASTLPRADLEFFALHMPTEPWRQLADVVHFRPTDFQVPWFLSFVHGEAAPEEALVRQGACVTESNVLDLCTRFHLPYSHVRRQVSNLTRAVRAVVAEYEKLDTLLWYYEELACPEVDAIIGQRLADGEVPTLSYGKVMERLLLFRQRGSPFTEALVPIAQAKLDRLALPLERPILVFGDSSYSMDVAIRCSTIIASTLTVLAGAQLRFFSDVITAPDPSPTTVPQVLDVALNSKATGLTAPACCLWQLYRQKEVVKFIVMVTDEIENEQSEGEFFAQLFWRYHREVYPARLVFVSFLENPNEPGRMVRALTSLGIEPIQFRLNSQRPDLTKVDALLGMLASEADGFEVSVAEMASVWSGDVNAMIAALAQRRRRGPDVADDAASPSSVLVTDGTDHASIVRSFDAEATGVTVPEGFVCPISEEIMVEPVVAADGFSYERGSIEGWIERSGNRSPMTNAPLPSLMLFPNHSLRTQIREWVEEQQRQHGTGKGEMPVKE